MTVVPYGRPTSTIGRAGPSSGRSADDQFLAAFREQSLQFYTALKNIPQGLCLFDADRLLILSNGRYAEIYGLPGDQIRPGMMLHEILALRAVGGDATACPRIPATCSAAQGDH